MKYNKLLNKNLLAIYAYIQTNPSKIDLHLFIQWVMEYGYYKELLSNWIIIKDLIEYHNNNIVKVSEIIGDYV